MFPFEGVFEDDGEADTEVDVAGRAEDSDPPRERCAKASAELNSKHVAIAANINLVCFIIFYFFVLRCK